MALSKLENLYRQVILDHSSHPHNHGTLENSSQHIEMNNPTCGDVIHLELQTEDGIIKDIAFSGHGCSISTASASMMTEAVKGKTVKEAMALAEDFSLLVQGKEVEEVEKLGDAEILNGVSKFPARIKCATLSWNALKKALEDPNSGVADAGFIKHDG
ncbi:SUF system NifU family Fe-S cluster assembly protein [Tetragenococcus koreensis]|uniref:Nitrogen fixation protein NifU n=1 Tax=Tetragenococcus koreensis TaxID=290335 RepID=A0AAN4ZQB5_9ENTE|nr:SUF system NifU family Fe-S cluster assembly protein [Tetragenococcus koreensis]AYW45706.1 SUF system NifU family Fe-S cluster assembly protein [Tetragenococcus koreensis]MCF1585549.1 SUF system NifU family Fe-S cluster assembly protein [Tetragenococcus koreensis]MCF1615095.1 SUF system NifU family Fe-S cluster assembly protein [Tetragenococcus koreensis]MCF1616895.1 SUF system NifU family Fe-S cluster assembly protein [Tetragenococcus koreensis]MCF1620140.1 SUF system NifU family Fe-S clus